MQHDELQRLDLFRGLCQVSHQFLHPVNRLAKKMLVTCAAWITYQRGNEVVATHEIFWTAAESPYPPTFDGKLGIISIKLFVHLFDTRCNEIWSLWLAVIPRQHFYGESAR